MGADVQGWQGRLPAVPKLDVPVVGGGQHVALLAVPSGLERSIGTAESHISIKTYVAEFSIFPFWGCH